MADFTSALFLDHHHSSRRLSPWASLTTGRPAAVEESCGAKNLAERMARRHGSDAGVLHRSAFHGLWDVVDLCARKGTVLLVDQAAYPFTLYATAGAFARDVHVVRYHHHDAEDVHRMVRTQRLRPIVLTDGWCPDCGLPAPLRALCEVVSGRGGVMIVDDTLACGVLGHDPSTAEPFGYGGGGTASWLGLADPAVVELASLGKAYGAPVAVTTGRSSIIGPLRSHGTRWHSGQPSAADVAAGLAATDDERANDRRRRSLAGLVTMLRNGLTRSGLSVSGLPFPMVSVHGSHGAVRPLYDRLAGAGVRTLLRRPRCWAGCALTFAVRAEHRMEEIERVLDIVDGTSELAS